SAFALVAGTIYFAARRRERSAAAEEKAKAGAAEGDSADLYGMLSVEPIELAVGQSLIPLVGAGGGFTERVVAFRKQFALDMGAGRGRGVPAGARKGREEARPEPLRGAHLRDQGRRRRRDRRPQSRDQSGRQPRAPRRPRGPRPDLRAAGVLDPRPRQGARAR